MHSRTFFCAQESSISCASQSHTSRVDYESGVCGSPQERMTVVEEPLEATGFRSSAALSTPTDVAIRNVL